MDDSRSSKVEDPIETPDGECVLPPSGKKALWPIVRDRWSEVMMIVVLNAGLVVWMQYLLREINSGERSALERLSDATGFFLGMGTMAYAIITQMLLLGFLVSVVHEGPRRQEPATLLLAGRYFFWRWIRFMILEAVLLVAGAEICFQILNATVLHVQSLADVPGWAKLVSGLFPSLILIKLVLVVPADMMVRNRMVFESIWSMRDYSLMRMKMLAVVYLLMQTVMIFIGRWTPQTGQADWISFSVWSGQGIWMAVGQFVVLLWAVLEVMQIRRPQRVSISMDTSERKDP